jgi:hypothetical protein
MNGVKPMGILDGTRSRAGGSGKRSLAERFEPFFSKSFSFKAVMCLGIAVSLLLILVLLVAFTSGSSPGIAGTVANGSSTAGSPSAGYASTSATTSPANASNETGGIANGSMSYSDGDERHNLTQRSNEINPSPTPVVAPKLPLEVLWDQPFYESIKTIQDLDRKRLLVSDTNYRFDGGTLLIDPASTYGGAQYAYPGDSIGMRLMIYNNGKPLDSIVGVDLSLLKMTDEKLHTYTGTGVDLHYDMRVDMDVNTRLEKNITINVPDESLRSPGYYRLCVKLYVNDTLSSDMSKDFNVL